MTLIVVKNEPVNGQSYIRAVSNLLQGASALDLAISYVKIGGWKLIASEINKVGIQPSAVRILVTDQFAITQPDAVREIERFGAAIRNYVGNRVYHPKVMIAYRLVLQR